MHEGLSINNECPENKELSTQTYPILILDNILPYGSQGGPFTVISGPDSAAFMGFEFAHWKTQPTHTSVWSTSKSTVTVSPTLDDDDWKKKKNVNSNSTKMNQLCDEKKWPDTEGNLKQWSPTR